MPKPSVEALIKEFESNKEPQLASIWALAETGDEKVVLPLTRGFNNADPNVRWNVARALKQLASPLAVEPLLLALNDQNDEVKKEIGAALAKIGDRRAVEPFLRIIRQGGDVGGWFSSYLTELQYDEVVPGLLEILNDTHSPGCANAIFALGTIGDRSAVEPLLNILNDPHSPLAYDAGVALGDLKESRAVDPILELLDKDGLDPILINALGKIGDKRCFEPLLKILNDKTIPEDDELDIRGTAAFALGLLGDRRAIQPLIEHLYDTEIEVRRGAATGLGLLGDVTALAALEEVASNDKSYNETGITVSETALKAIKDIKTGLNLSSGTI